MSFPRLTTVIAAFGVGYIISDLIIAPLINPKARAATPPNAIGVVGAGGTNAESLVLWSRQKPVVTKTHEGWTVRFGK